VTGGYRVFAFQPCSNCCRQCIACKDYTYPDSIAVWFSGIPETAPPGFPSDYYYPHYLANDQTWVIPFGTASTEDANANGEQMVVPFAQCYTLVIDNTPGAEFPRQYTYTVSYYLGSSGPDAPVCGVSVQWRPSILTGTGVRIIRISLADTKNGPHNPICVFQWVLEESAAASPFDCTGFSSLNIPVVGELGPVCEITSA
jgi:hypothetical protein